MISTHLALVNGITQTQHLNPLIVLLRATSMTKKLQLIICFSPIILPQPHLCVLHPIRLLTLSTSHVCTSDNRTTLETDPKLSYLNDPVKFTSVQPSDVIGKEFAFIVDAETFYNNYSLFDQGWFDHQSTITISSKQ